MGNSRFKFRAWIDTEKKMMSHEEHISYGDTLSYEEVFEAAIDEIPMMQYTGLKDKKGVEIYCDDILSFHSPLTTEIDYAQIKAVRGGFVFVRKFWWNDETFPEMGDALADMQTRSWVEDNCEVIGNICENPELLKG